MFLERMSRKQLSIVFLILMFLIIAILLVIQSRSNFPNSDIIGYDKDDYGCLISAGYSWSNDAEACIRIWEITNDEKAIIKVLSKELNYNITILDINKNNEDYIIKAEDIDKTKFIVGKVNNLKIVDLNIVAN